MAIQPLLPFDEEEPLSTSSRLIEEIAAVCAELPFEEKVLIAPSLAIGHQLVEQLALSGRVALHLRVETFRTLAHSVVGPSLAREGRRLLSRAQALALIEQACAETLVAGSYFGELRDRPGLHRALQRTFDELRAAGIARDALPAAAFEDPRKHRELTAILNRYETALEEGKFADSADVLRRATEAESLARPAAARIYLVPAGTELSHVEERLLGRLAGDRWRRLAEDPPEEGVARARDAVLSRCVGEENEIREVFRTILSDGIPFDEVELLHTDSSVYPALVFELAAEHGVSCTFAEGIAVTFTRPGRAARAFLEWLRGGFEAEQLRKGLVSGALSPGDAGENGAAPGPFAVARAWRDAGIGWGKPRHLSALDALVHELGRPHEARARDERSTEERERDQAARARRLAAARQAREFAERVVELAPDAGAVSLAVLARGTSAFVTEFARVASELDGTARSALEELFAELSALPPAPLPLPDAVERLSDAVASLHVDADRARPGRLHVAHFASGGYTGRNHVFFVGLDDARHPGEEAEDPVLLDRERRALNTAFARELALSGARPRRTERAFKACLARQRGRMRASYSGWDLRQLAQPGERFPAAILLEIFRRRRGEAHADYRRLDAVLGSGVGFVPSGKRALDEVEWWLARLTTAGPPGEGAPAVLEAYPWLADGARAEAERESPRFTEFDGWVRADASELDPRVNGEPISCSRIEALARCPYMYFLRHVLRVEPPEELERDPTRWLDPMKTGSLLHEVFRRFFEKITEANEKPSLGRHSPLLGSIVDSEISIWRELIPPASDAAFTARREEIRFAARTFLRLEEEHCRKIAPRFFEVPFGLSRAESAGGIASPEPIEISLGGGRSFRLRGCVDRIDESPDGTFMVWDYKTGSSFGVREELGLRGGRQVQFALYAMAVEALLARAGRPGRVTRSGYFFPGKKGQGQRFALPLDVAETRDVLNALFDLLADGAFPHAVDPEDCRFCDFEAVCGGAERAAERARRKMGEVAPPVLRTFWRMHGGESD